MKCLLYGCTDCKHTTHSLYKAVLLGNNGNEILICNRYTEHIKADGWMGQVSFGQWTDEQK